MTDDHVNRALDRSLVFADDCDGIAPQLLPARWVGQEIFQDEGKFVGVLDLGSAIPGQKDSHHVREILHVWPKNHRLAQLAGFDRILTSLGGEALANENHGGVLVEMLQFAGGVDNQAIHFAFAELRVGGDLVSIDKLDAQRLEVAADIPAALEMNFKGIFLDEGRRILS